MENEILPCPFCGLEPTLTENFPREGLHTLSCENQICAIHPYTVEKTKEDCIFHWNRRVPDEPIVEPKPLTLDELRGMDGDPVFLIAEDWSAWVLVNGGLEFVRSAHCGEMSFSDYGKTWLAYDREVKGDGNNG